MSLMGNYNSSCILARRIVVARERSWSVSEKCYFSDQWTLVCRRVPTQNAVYPCSPETLLDPLSYSRTMCLQVEPHGEMEQVAIYTVAIFWWVSFQSNWSCRISGKNVDWERERTLHCWVVFSPTIFCCWPWNHLKYFNQFASPSIAGCWCSSFIITACTSERNGLVPFAQYRASDLPVSLPTVQASLTHSLHIEGKVSTTPDYAD